MTKIKLGVLSAVILTGVTVPLVLHQSAQNKLNSKNQALRQQLELMDRLTAMNQQLSNQLAQAIPANESMNELMRLRGEVTALRQYTNELMRMSGQRPSHLGTENLDLAGDLTPTNLSSPNILPKEAWSFAGYGTPQAALQSITWAMSKGDVKTFLDSLTQEAHETVTKEFAGKSPSEIAEQLQNAIKELEVLRLDRVKDVSDREVTFVLYSIERDDGSKRMRDESVVKFTKIGEAWKSTGF